MGEEQTKRINIDIQVDTWRNIGLLAAQLGKTKKEVVNEALHYYHWTEKANLNSEK